jgi:hypothetical protein
MRSTRALLGRQRRAFTMLEMSLVTALMSFLVVLISGIWTGIGRAITDVAADARIAQEANLALESFSRDFAGSLPGQASGSKGQGRIVGKIIFGTSFLFLCFDGDADGVADWAFPDVVVLYHVEAGRLMRWSWQPMSEFAVADCVDGMQISELGDGVRVDLTFRYREVTETYTIVAKNI